MSTQNCKVVRSIGQINGYDVEIEHKDNQVQYCVDVPCKPVGILGYPAEGCAYCNKTF